MSSMDQMFEIAQALRRSHCDRKEREHECVGECTIARGEIRLSCQLCGRGEHLPGWSHAIADKLKKIFDAAGVSWDSLDIEAKSEAIHAFRKSEVNT